MIWNILQATCALPVVWNILQTTCAFPVVWNILQTTCAFPVVGNILQTTCALLSNFFSLHSSQRFYCNLQVCFQANSWRPNFTSCRIYIYGYFECLAFCSFEHIHVYSSLAKKQTRLRYTFNYIRNNVYSDIHKMEIVKTFYYTFESNRCMCINCCINTISWTLFKIVWGQMKLAGR